MNNENEKPTQSISAEHSINNELVGQKENMEGREADEKLWTKSDLEES